MNKENIINFFRQLPRHLRSMLCWLVGFSLQLPRRLWNMLCWIFDIAKDIYRTDDGDFWKELYKNRGNIWEKKLKPAYKEALAVVFERKKERSFSLKKGALKLPGSGPLDNLIDRALMMGVVLGAFGGGGVALLFGYFFPFVLLLLLAVPVLTYQMYDYALGYKGEKSVAEGLANLGRRELWRVFHSVTIPGLYGNIDHIIVSWRGIFCLETKVFRGDSVNVDKKTGETYLGGGKGKGNWKCPTGQAKGNAKALREFLKKECKCAIPFVVPVVFFVDVTVRDAYVAEKLIVGNSEKMKDVFTEFVRKFGNKRRINGKQFEKICAVLDKENRRTLQEVADAQKK